MSSVPALAGTRAFLFAGQGVQAPGMADFLDGQPVAQEVFDIASEALGADVRALMRLPQEELDRTVNAQPALCALEMAESRLLVSQGVIPAAVLGFSLGQIPALEAAGMLDAADVFRLVKRRAELMDAAAQARPGAMDAVLRLEPAEVEALCEEAAGDQVLVAANYNCPGQTVVSGELEALGRLEGLVGRHKGARAVRLATSGAFHSPLMAEAAEELRAFCRELPFREPSVPLIANDTAEPLTAARAADALADHLTHPVRFQASIEALVAAGMAETVEVGPGDVLTKLVKRIDRSVTRRSVASALADRA